MKTIYLFFDEEENTISARENWKLSFIEMKLPKTVKLFPIIFAVGETLKYFGFTEKEGGDRKRCWKFEKED